MERWVPYPEDTRRVGPPLPSGEGGALEVPPAAVPGAAEAGVRREEEADPGEGGHGRVGEDCEEIPRSLVGLNRAAKIAGSEAAVMHRPKGARASEMGGSEARRAPR